MSETTLLPDIWRLLRTPPADGAWNMAVDLGLMDVAKRDRVGVLRVYGWSRPTVSFGRNERVAGVYVPEELAAAGLDFVRRPTGGRALLHAREVTYSVALPIDDQVRWSRVYAAINQCLLTAMQALGLAARLAVESPLIDEATASKTPSHEQGVVCFSGIAPGEIAIENRKLIASSVWRERGAYLQHGSILISDDQSKLTALMGARIASPEPAAALADLMAPELSADAIVNAVERELNCAVGYCGKTEPWSIPREVLKQVDVTRLALTQSTWLWRR
ncbi:MAG: hypothetical protein ABI852_00380 [Gemmatimonadaceae bacterium]